MKIGDKTVNFPEKQPTGLVVKDAAAESAVAQTSFALESAKPASLVSNIPVTNNDFSLYASSIGIPEVLEAGLHIRPQLNKEQIAEIDNIFMTRLLETDGAVVDLASGNSDTAIEVNKAAQTLKAYRVDPFFSNPKKVQDFDSNRDKVGGVFNIPMADESVGFLICKGLCDYMNEPLFVNLDGKEVDINEQMAYISGLGFRAVEALRQKKMNTFKARNDAYEKLQRTYRPYYNYLKLDLGDFKNFLDEAYRVMKPGAELRIFNVTPTMLVNFQANDPNAKDAGEIDKVYNDKRMNDFKKITSRFSEVKWHHQLYYREAYDHVLNSDALDYLDSITSEHNQEISGALLVLKK